MGAGNSTIKFWSFCRYCTKYDSSLGTA